MADRLLELGYTVVALDHRLGGKCLPEQTLARVVPVEADIRDEAAVIRAAADCEAIFHFAAVVGVEAYDRQAERMAEVESLGVKSVCKAARAVGAAILYASSSAVYGSRDPGRGHLEDAACPPGSNYACAKLKSESHLEREAKSYGLDATALRIFNVYGPRQDERLVVPRFVRLAKAGEPIVIFGDGTQTRDFVYVGDVVDAALACAGSKSGFEIVNACTGVETSVGQLAGTIILLTGSASQIELRPPPGLRTNFEVERSFGSVEKLMQHLERPLVPLRAGLVAAMGGRS